LIVGIRIRKRNWSAPAACGTGGLGKALSAFAAASKTPPARHPLTQTRAQRPMDGRDEGFAAGNGSTGPSAVDRQAIARSRHMQGRQNKP
jgi:hypothetical protein